MMIKQSTETIVKPENIWKHFEEHKSKLREIMEPVAINDEYDVIIYLTNENELPCLIAESSNFKNQEHRIKDEKSCTETARMVYNLYLTEQIIMVIMNEEEDEDTEPDVEDEIFEREADLDSFVERFIEDAFEGDPILYSNKLQSVVEDCKEHFLEYLYRKHGLSAYRPMELEDDDGVFIENYPYECMEYDSCSLYDDKK